MILYTHKHGDKPGTSVMVVIPPLRWFVECTNFDGDKLKADPILQYKDTRYGGWVTIPVVEEEKDNEANNIL